MQLQGLRLDGKFSDSAPFTWAHAKNILLSRGFDEIENEPGDTAITTDLGGIIIGKVTLPNAILLVQWKDSKTYIKYIIYNSSTAVYDVYDLISGGTAILTYNPSSYPAIYIEGVHCYNSESEIIVAFTTGYHKPLILNVTELISTPITIASESDLKNLYLFPEFIHNNFVLSANSETTSAAIISGGRLPSAAYFISLTYELEIDVNTNFGILSNPIFVTENDILTDYLQAKGNTSLVITTKAISISVSNLDTTRDYFRLAVIQRTESSTECYITKRIKIDKVNSTTNVLISDLDDLTLFSVNDVIVSSPAFSTVKTLTQSNKRLRIGNLTKFTKSPIATVYNNLFTPISLNITGGTYDGYPDKYNMMLTYDNTFVINTGDIVRVEGFATADWNGYFNVTKYDDTHFYYRVTTIILGAVSVVGVTGSIDIVSVNWISEKQASLSTTKDSYKDTVFIFNSRGFRSDEVYALYLGLRLKTGGFYGIYHIPGRAEFGDEHTATDIDGTNYDLYKIGSTALKVGDYYGKMGFWENENETYGGLYGTYLGSDRVRHHRMPSAGQLKNWIGNRIEGVDVSEILNEFSTGGAGVVIAASTDGDYATITSSINAGDSATYGTWSTVTSGAYSVNKYEATAKHSFNISLRYTINSINYTYSLSAIVITHKTAGHAVIATHTKAGIYYSASSSIILITNTTFNLEIGEYLEINIKYQTSDRLETVTIYRSDYRAYLTALPANILGLSISVRWDLISSFATTLSGIVDGWEIFYAKRTLNDQLMLDQSLVFTEGAGYRFYGFDSMCNLLNIESTHVKAELEITADDYVATGDVTDVAKYTVQAAEYSEIKKIKYLPAYNTATNPANTGKENCYYLETLSGTFNNTLLNLINIKDNVYLDFSKQNLVSTGLIKKLTDYAYYSFYGGDTFIGHNTILRFESAVAKIWSFPVESILNSGLRYEGENDYEKCYPYTNILNSGILAAMAAAGVANTYFYNNTFHLLNNLRQDNIDDSLTSIVNTFPNRIYSSMPQPLEATSVYWKKFKILDYFDMVNNKGAIYKMLGNEYIVYIKTDYSVFRGIVIDKLETEAIDVALKTTSMFDRPLEELLDTDGTYIQHWDRDGIILTPFGLIIADLIKGSIYQISDKATEITKLGIEDWFREVVTRKLNFGTKEATSTGVILGYDDTYKRLLVTLHNEDIPVVSAVRSLVDGILILTTTTTNNHNLRTGDTVRFTGWDYWNGIRIVTVTGLKTFTAVLGVGSIGAITGGTLKTLDDITLSFSFEKAYWIAFHSYIADRYIWNSVGLFNIVGGIIYKMLTGNFGYYTGTYANSHIDFIFNNNQGQRFLLKHIKWTTHIEQDGIDHWDKTISKLLVYSKDLCGSEISITKESYDYDAVTYVMEKTGNTIYHDGEWIYNDVVDYLSNKNTVFIDGNFNIMLPALNLSKSWYNLSKFIGKFVIIRMIYTNEAPASGSLNKKCRINNIAVDVKPIL